ncbi:hypothetical protein QP921_07915 [Corynebacterium pseudodiphtheriticum]|uniref:hypothetical protein n=1 Tax=Corynebacterium pseudodiphtheriticum TaxID=37637 RepID=UPI0025503E42|nr:hypothetical protein [Corynebacterium pseudodiphtheriticum]MDK8487287.1 hypothetical protein [Corynebacterium pseudodiphtheriticum]MDK8494533.1 hypothetical protein [Corynebacterium pseudodiphtheriticum]MDK8614742.1 hypothetical protein [Corynebacterium pseudodiphtheriticum]MDK8718489.1 hypothetical protein [Corynebacterium pseudodiphtheriticum]MDK8738681.1 hypothetical protein [Corynebacterium pseudodiphtheriticum]
MFTFNVLPEIVSMGGSTPSRIQGREAVAETKVSIQLPDKKSLEKCLYQLEVSDARLAERGPKIPGPYDWQFVIKEVLEDGSAVVHFGVAWYDIGYFNEKKSVFQDPRHSNMFSSMGASHDDVSVEHWIKSS